MGHFAGKVALVTGAASGIGRALCQELGPRGAVVWATDINQEGAEQVAVDIVADGGQARAAYLDVTQAGDVEAVVKEAVAAEGRLDFMFNIAGICMTGEVRDMTLEQWHRLVDVNYWGIVHGTISAYRLMIRQGFGHIVNMGSAEGLMPFPMDTAYSSTKHAVIGLTTSLRPEAAGLGVKVSVVCPGLIRTGMQDGTILVTPLRNEAELRRRFTEMRVGMEADRCARVILRGVERNRGIIVVTAFSRLCWYLYRLHPALIKPLNNAWVKTVRENRLDA
jgi:NAD(P)-dependent dehydrogenase (short-subunit alcohol dehydrogenase family)